MPFRERMKRALRRTSKSSSSSSSTSSNSTTIDPSVIYQPGEKMPLPKYRRPVAKEHKEKLEAFSFGGPRRRKSNQSLYSPMGSRMPSRRNSLVLGRKSFAERRENIAVDDLSREPSDSDDEVSQYATPGPEKFALQAKKPFDMREVSSRLRKEYTGIMPP